MSENDKLVNFKAPEETVNTAKAKLEHGEMSERLRQTLEQIAHGSEVAERTRVKDRLQEERKERREIETKIRDLQDKRDEKDRNIERLEERLDVLAEQEGEYDGFLQSIESALKEGQRFWESHAQIEKAADIGNTTPEQVMTDLKERNPEVPDEQFRMNPAR